MTRVPLAHFLLRRLGSEFVERKDARQTVADARRLLQTARRSESLAFFPEGTFTSEPGLRRFHNGAFAAAVRAQMPVVPIVIRGSRHMLPASRVMRDQCGSSHCEAGPSTYPPPYTVPHCWTRLVAASSPTSMNRTSLHRLERRSVRSR